jgi:hypothetical protein
MNSNAFCAEVSVISDEEQATITGGDAAIFHAIGYVIGTVIRVVETVVNAVL